MVERHPADPTPAELYDLQFADANRGDVPFYRDRAVAADGPVLELACGTGRVHLDLLAAGVDADGIDLDAERLARLRERATERGLDPSIRKANMLDFETNREYDLVICPFNTVQHATGVDDQLTLLETVHDALRPGGRFVFDTFVPSFDVIRETYGEWDETTVTDDGREYAVRSRSTMTDEVAQRFRVETVAAAPDGRVIHEERHELSMLPKQQVELLAHASRFDDWTVAGSFDGDELTDDDLVQVWTLRKSA